MSIFSGAANDITKSVQQAGDNLIDHMGDELTEEGGKLIALAEPVAQRLFDMVLAKIQAREVVLTVEMVDNKFVVRLGVGDKK